MLLLLPYRTVMHDFFLDIPVFCLLRVSVYTHQGSYTHRGVYAHRGSYTHQVHLCWRRFSFYANILDRPSVILANAKITIFVCLPFCSSGIQALITDQVPQILVVYDG
ncbi:hypothetical protein ES705_42732 [subsurface metagenome]